MIITLFCAQDQVSTMRRVASKWIIFLLICSVMKVKAQVLPNKVAKTLVQDAFSKGAVCLDGSPAAYHYDKGSGDGVNNWVVWLEGGGWCKSVKDCGHRFNYSNGSSNHMDSKSFYGLLSNSKTSNPDFYNWHRIMIRYCDGSSYTGDVELVDKVTNQHYRGARIFQAIMEELLAKGMKNAKNAILSGCSAGGLGTMFHCDRFRSLLPSTARVKCLSDGAYFLLDTDFKRARILESTYDGVLNLHNSAKMLPPSCTSRMNPTSCFFPQNIQQDIKTPLFILNSAYDSWQIVDTVIPFADRQDFAENCKKNLSKCSPDQQKLIRGFGVEFLSALPKSYSPSQRGMYINSCLMHCQTDHDWSWNSNSDLLNNKTIAKVFGDWFFEQDPSREMVKQQDLPQICRL
ncbi:pectin acetylesterase 8 [Nicotiana attenuata]|uniref:Pectin acetylesterase n=2 Tax=Nicotiana attenuata TaxID=49451 RepID=A0A1J6K8Y9_NICAT|nr:pectin acetylesterase 8 [Nicotiana attenuata]